MKSLNLIINLPNESRENRGDCIGCNTNGERCISRCIWNTTTWLLYKDGTKTCFTAIVEVNADGKPIDLLTVCDKLKAKRSNLKAYDVAALTNKLGSSANIEAHAWILKNKY